MVIVEGGWKVVRRWSKVVGRWSEGGRRWSKVVEGGRRWSEGGKVHDKFLDSQQVPGFTMGSCIHEGFPSSGRWKT